MTIDKFNSEGYYDPTSYEALTQIQKEEMTVDKKAAYLPLVYIIFEFKSGMTIDLKR